MSYNAKVLVVIVTAIIIVVGGAVGLQLTNDAYDHCVEQNSKAYCLATLEQQTNMYVLEQFFNDKK